MFFHKDLLDILICPLCYSELQLEIFSPKRKDGLFICKNNHYFPIINGLPKILIGKLRGDYSSFFKLYRNWFVSKGLLLDEDFNEREESKQVQETFFEKWTSKDSIGISDSSPYKDFMRKWMFTKYGWKSEPKFRKAIKDKKMILDAGAGLGREVINLARTASKSIVIGLEFSDCAVNALKNIRSLRNAFIIQGDILRMPFKRECFDFILSEGVLHHTPNTEEAFDKCCRVLKRKGEIAFYIYRKKGPIREFSDDYIRDIIQKVSVKEKWRIAEKITRLGQTLAELKTKVRILEDIPEIGIKKGEIDIQRFIYWNFLKCFWNEKLPFDENKIINFDWYVPKHSHRHTEEEIKKWCKKNSIDIIWFNEEESGYSVRGVKR